MIFIFIISLAFQIMEKGKAQPPPLKFTLTDTEPVADFSPYTGYMPDGGISIVKSLKGNQYFAYWPFFESFRTLADTADLRDHIGKLNPTGKVIGGRRNPDGSGTDFATSFSDGGAWLYDVDRLQDNRLVGFIHSHSHWYPGDDGTSHKSIGVAYSTDDGRSWSINDNSQIITAPYDKPVNKSWTGVGDFDVVYNPFNGRFMCYYMAVRFLQNDPTSVNMGALINLAASSDQTAAPSTWRKWNGVDFSEPGKGGNDTPLPNISKKPGANPTVHYNTFLLRWIMVWCGWDRVFYISSSYDGILWADPQVFLDESKDIRYPTIIGESRELGGQKSRLYYGKDIPADNFGRRKMMTREITFSY